MPYFRRPKDHDHPYQPIPNTVLDDADLSFKAKGILCYLLSRSDEWEVYQAQLEDLGPDGEHAIRSGLNELIEAGYIERNRRRGDLGEFQGYEYVIYEDPVATTSGFSGTGKSSTGKSSTGKSSRTKDGKNQRRKEPKTDGSGGSAPARMPEDLLPLYETYEEEVNALLEQYDPSQADQVVMRKWGQVGVNPSTTRLAREHEWPYYVAAVVITANEANNPNPRYLDTLLTALTQLDESTARDPSESEQRSNLERLVQAAKEA